MKRLERGYDSSGSALQAFEYVCRVVLRTINITVISL